MIREDGTFTPESEIPDPGNTNRLKTVGVIVGGLGLAMVADYTIKAINEGDLLKAAPVAVGIALMGIGKAYVDEAFRRTQNTDHLTRPSQSTQNIHRN